MPSSPFPLAGKQGRGGATPAAPEGGGPGLDGASGGGEEREEEVGVRFPYLARAGGERLWHPRRRRWGAGKGCAVVAGVVWFGSGAGPLL